jgi:primosomal replication protein N''
MMRFCPKCKTERPPQEIFCDGQIDGQPCNWDLSTEPFKESGWRPTSIEDPARPTSTLPFCQNGHSVNFGDLICPNCGADLNRTAPLTPELHLSGEPQEQGAPIIIDGWRLGRQLTSSSNIRERFIADRITDARQAVLTLYREGAEPDPSVYEVLRSLPLDHVPEILATGRWEDRAYEVVEELTGGTLEDVGLLPNDLQTISQIVKEVGRALHAFSEVGLRHRDLRPRNILIRSHNPLDLVVIGFGSARLSDFDLDIVSPLETTRYMAPEAIAGGVAAASDWWSLGMVILEQVTRGACFKGINEQVFLIHILSKGVPLPDDLDPQINVLLRGLLARNRTIRWQWKEVHAWLRGGNVVAPDTSQEDIETEQGPSITIGGRQYRSALAYALAAAEAANWDNAQQQLLRGAIATWAEERGFDPKIQAGIRQICCHEGLTDDFRLSIALKILNPSIPLTYRGDIVTPGWLLNHLAEGYDLITGPAPDILSQMETEVWLSQLKARATNVRNRAKTLNVELNEEELRVHLLSTSKARLIALWDERRRILPDTDHAGLALLLERRLISEEDLTLLLGASVEQFRSVDDILKEAREIAQRIGIETFDESIARALLEQPRRDIYSAIDQRLEGFARCDILQVDQWADQYRLERRMHIGRALALLAVSKNTWKEPPRQQYVSAILDYFAKKISGSVLRGPLVRMMIGKSSARIDLLELGSERRDAGAILDQLLNRTDHIIDIDPAVFIGSDTLEHRLRALFSHSLLYKRDTGIDGLYLGFPFLLIRDTGTSIKPRIAPVLLWPIQIKPEVGNRGHVSIGFDRDREEVRLNPAFEGLIGIEATKRWQAAAVDLLGRTSISVAETMDGFGSLAISRGRTLGRLPGQTVDVAPGQRELACAAVLFHVAYTGQAIAEDLRQLKAIPLAGTGLETALRVSTKPPLSADKTAVSEIDRYFTVASDPSQEEAVLQARTAPGIVVEGPPGTGKSQTIVNMIADAIAMKKSLLVVCQKLPALEVVRKRLMAVGLGHRIVMMTDINKDREPVLRSIREQVEVLLRLTAASTPSWERNRPRVAARIEAMEAELNRHYAAMQQVDHQTGLNYRTLLGELLMLEKGERPPIDVPALRQVLEEYGLLRLASVEDACGPVAKHWLPAMYEDSCLASLKPFSADAAILPVFVTEYNHFVSAENNRMMTTVQNPSTFEVEDVKPFVDWINVFDSTVRSIHEKTFTNLSHWIHLFITEKQTEPWGFSAILKFENIFSRLKALDVSAHEPKLFNLLIDLSDDELWNWIGVAKFVTTKGSILNRLNPYWHFKRHKLRRFLVSHGHDPTEVGMTRFLLAAQLEDDLRPLRNASGKLIAVLNGIGTAGTSIAGLIAAVAENLASLKEAATLFTTIDLCPRKDDAYAAARIGTLSGYNSLISQFNSAIARCNVRQLSRVQLNRLEPWFEASWIHSCLIAIDNNVSNQGTLSQILKALPTLSAYQIFRMRAAQLSVDALLVFRILREKNAELSEVPSLDLEAEIRRIINREARLAWKSRLERSEPALLYERSEIESKVASLAEACAEMRRLNGQLLKENINISKIRPLREWEAITRLRGQRSRRLREFMDHGADLGLMEIRPVWLMNPDMASRVLPLKSGMFDSVIYDEASQMPVEYALPSLFRVFSFPSGRFRPDFISGRACR